jgi:hypothetical protein
MLGLFVLAFAPMALGQAERWDREQYYLANLNGKRVGYMAERERALPDGTIETFAGMRLTLAVIGTEVKMAVTDQKIESAAGQPMSFTEYRLLGEEPVQRTGKIAASQLEVTTLQGGRTLTRKQPWNGAVLFPHAQDKQTKEKLKADGDSMEYVDYSSDRPGDGSYKVTLKRAGWEETSIGGRKVKALRIVRTEQDVPPANVWVDKDFTELAMEINMGPMLLIRAEACTREVAHAAFPAAEVFTSSTVRLEPSLKDVAKIKSFRLTLVYSKPLESPLELPATDRQKVVESTVDKVVVDLTRPDYPDTTAGAAAKAPTSLPDSLKGYLQSAELFNTEDPLIAQAAKDAVGGRTDPIAKAKAIRDWVNQRISHKDLGVGQGTASEVIRSRKGDCSEHAALLVAVARAAGIPARTVMGLAYAASFAGLKDILGGHEWAQLYIAGRWVDFDAALGGDPPSASRVAFSLGSADGKDSIKAQMNFVRLFGNLASAKAEKVERE